MEVKTMSINLSKARASATPKAKGGALRITHRKSGDLLKISPEILRKLNVGKEAFGKSGKGISIFFLDDAVVIGKDLGDGYQTLSGDLDYPEVYSSFVGQEVCTMLGKELAMNKTISFPDVTYDQLEGSGEPVAVVNINEYSCAADALIEKEDN